MIDDKEILWLKGEWEKRIKYNHIKWKKKTPTSKKGHLLEQDMGGKSPVDIDLLQENIFGY